MTRPRRPAALPEAQWQLITPKLAQELLEHNEVNRKVRQSVVDAYAEDMASGLWGMTGEPLQVSRTGRLLNGQHRCLAVIKSGTGGVWMLVLTGLDDKAQELMDQGATRTTANVLQMLGVKSSANVAALAKWLNVAPEPVSNMETLVRRRVSRALVSRTYHEHQDEIEAAMAAFHQFRSYIPGAPTPLTYSWLVLNRVDPGDCSRFFSAMVDMTFPALHDPRKAALRRLQVMGSEPGAAASGSRGVAVVSVLTRSWNYWRKGEELSTIAAFTSGGGKGSKVIAPVLPV